MNSANDNKATVFALIAILFWSKGASAFKILKKKITYESIVAIFINIGDVFLISTQGDFISIKIPEPDVYRTFPLS